MQESTCCHIPCLLRLEKERLVPCYIHTSPKVLTGKFTLVETELQASFEKVWARNFRSIEYAELELGALTTLVGPNASGKSNLLDLFGFLADAGRHSLETAITRRGGIDSIGRKSPSGRILGPEIGFRYVNSEGKLEYSVSLTRIGRGDYRVKKEYAKLQPTDSGDASFECELNNGRPY